jgi:hypothetical protein
VNEIKYTVHPQTNNTMKKIILEILLGLSLTAIFHTMLTNVFTAEKPVTKQISYSIARDISYNQQAYDKAVATVHVVIFKVRDHKQIVLWNKNYDATPLKNYPVTASALQQTVTVNNILEGKEKLYVTYTITYNTKGSTIQIENGTCLAKGDNKGRLLISL